MASAFTTRVRMYRMGLGDCFLLTFTPPGRKRRRPFHMLIDCGIYQNSPGIADRLKRVVGHIRDSTRDEKGVSRLDLLAITHEHYDHISGFSAEYPEVQAIWKEIRVAAVWMAWTEGDDPQARLLRENRRAKTEALKEVLRRISRWEEASLAGDARALAAHQSRLLALRQLLDFEFSACGGADTELAAGAAAPVAKPTSQEVMEFIKGKAESAVTFHYPGSGPIELEACPGVRFYVLGPPANEQLANSNPRRGEAYEDDQQLTLDDAFFSAAGLDRDGIDVEHYPFHRQYRVELPPESPPADAAEPPDLTVERRAALTLYRDCYCRPDERWRRIDGDWAALTSDLALQLVDDTNNTSLVLAIELPGEGGLGRVLLFPGDAQAGSWLSWHDHTWSVVDATGHKRPLRMPELLQRTYLYKVGHHGSHNATLRDLGLEQMGKRFGLVAMIPTDEAFAAEKRWKMPFKPLYETLVAKTQGRVIRADSGLPARDLGGAALSDAEWERFRRVARAGREEGAQADDDLYYEFEIVA